MRRQISAVQLSWLCEGKQVQVASYQEGEAAGLSHWWISISQLQDESNH
jgi:hypothetical protein